MAELTSAIGYTRPDGTPVFRITIQGVLSARHDFEAVLDTGFTGFVSMPLMDAFPLGLVLSGTESVLFANGAEENRLTAYGTVTVGPKSHKGAILLEPDSGEVLIGIQMLRNFNLSFLIDPVSNVVKLFDETMTKRVLAILSIEAEDKPK